MALVKCEYCGQDISSRAKKCPKCGQKRNTIPTTPCVECGAPVPVGAEECPNCGCPVETAAPQPEATQQIYVNPYYMDNYADRANDQLNYATGVTMYCPHCGAVIPASAVICTNCGCQTGAFIAEVPAVADASYDVPVNARKQNTEGTPVNKWVAFFLCYFFGFFGAHKFYEGDKAMGKVYLCTFGLFGFGWLADIIIILTKPNPYYVNK
ncbi:MAG: TM2 domain-containing protein [Clostridiales bacterium]|nr:TM2 domain-containing protein [Lachnospiraceae bacterium]MBR5058619.1 TM2 domain-containing protein [Clostridiales bacterium]